MEEIARFLQDVPPFNLLSPQHVQSISEKIQIEYFAEGEDVMVHNGPPAEYLYIIRRGSVDLLREDDRGVHVLDTLGEGDMFGYPSLIRHKPPIVTVRTREEVLAYLMAADLFHHLRRDIPSFTRFFATSAIERITQRLQAHDENASPELFRFRLRDLVQRHLVSVSPDVSVREAAQVMRDHNVSSVVIDTVPPGIITDRDLRNRVVATGMSDTTPVTSIMTRNVLSLSLDSLVFEALITMLEHGIHHMLVTEDNRAIGMVTHTDILRHQSKSPLFLPRQLQRARKMEDLQAYTQQVTATVGSLLDAGARVNDIGRIVAMSHDALIVRLLHDAEKTLGPPPCPYGWLVLGSEGRYEQTLRTDQDNALVYADDAPPEAAQYFAALAERVVEQLIACGFPRCPGDIMATNERWRQPLPVWKQYFQDWVDTPNEKVLVRVGIFFDFRQIHGTLEVEQALRPVIQRARDNKIFLGHLARVALRQHAPVSFFRQLVLERSGESRNLIDLKSRGTTLVVDLARLFSLEAGCSRTNTTSRLQRCLGQSDLSRSGAEELIAAFELISLLRLRYQYHQIQQGGTPTNQIPVSWLSALERRELKEALWAIARIQRNIELMFQTDLFA
jgi:CBS domain-containing protein